MPRKTYMRAPSGEVFDTLHPEYHKDCENLGGGSKGAESRQQYCAATLRKMLKPGQTVYTIVRRVSASGMSRDISAYVIHKGELRSIDSLAADAAGYNLSTKGAGITMHGCGMDMCFALVYAIGRATWPKGTPKPHGVRNGEPDKAGGYALKHCTL